MKLQTLDEFMKTPFNNGKSIQKQSEYDKEYNDYTIKRNIYIEGYTIIGKDHYIHIKIPSKSKEKYFYDVIIKFIAPENYKKLNDLISYYIQFFSNSPSFIYKYAVLYKNNGLLIEDLYNKMDPDYIDKLPEKANSDLEISFDKSIYFACKYLSQHKFRYLSKNGPIILKKKEPKKFFQDISTFKKIKIEQDFLHAEKIITNKTKKIIDQKIKEEEKTDNKEKKYKNIILSSNHTSGIKKSIITKKKIVRNNKIKAKKSQKKS